jgi:hypothetical protein
MVCYALILSFFMPVFAPILVAGEVGLKYILRIVRCKAE